MRRANGSATAARVRRHSEQRRGNAVLPIESCQGEKCKVRRGTAKGKTIAETSRAKFALLGRESERKQRGNMERIPRYKGFVPGWMCQRQGGGQWAEAGALSFRSATARSSRGETCLGRFLRVDSSQLCIVPFCNVTSLTYVVPSPNPQLINRRLCLRQNLIPHDAVYYRHPSSVRAIIE